MSNRALERTRLARRSLRPLGCSRMPVSDERYEIYLVAALFVYALPFVHNLRCVEIPFNAGYDLALRYLSVPVAAFIVLGGGRLRRTLGRQAYRLPAQMFVSAAIFGWMVGLG